MLGPKNFSKSLQVLMVLSLVCGSLFIVNCGKKEDNKPSSEASATPWNFATTPQPCNSSNFVGAGDWGTHRYGTLGLWGTSGLWGSSSSELTLNCVNRDLLTTNGFYGHAIWPNSVDLGYGNCGCPSGYVPSRGLWGHSCLPAYHFHGWGGVFAYWMSPQNTHAINIPQAYNHDLRSLCTSNIPSNCIVGQHCGGGRLCRQVVAHSPIGICY
jgi:hypothetical protein